MNGFAGIRARRYTERELPECRHVRGRQLHASTDAERRGWEGTGRKGAAADWRECEEYLYGCDLYNHGFWWEAHEVWEGLWQATDKAGVQGQFLQGLIQVAVCHLKLEMGSVNGVRRLLESSRGHIGRAMEGFSGESFMGVRLGEWYEAVESYYRMILGGSEMVHDGRRFPYLVLR